MHPTLNGLELNNFIMTKNQLIIEKLNNLLADYQIFYQNLRGFHWNIQGRNFFELHAKFEELYTDVAVKVDAIAERILTIAGKPLHSFEDYLNASRLEPVKNISADEAAVKTVISNIESILSVQREIKELASEASDSGTEDQISGFIEEQEKTIWMYKAWLNG